MTVSEVTVEGFHPEWINVDKSKTLRLIDVREEDEWKIGHVQGAEWIPLSAFANEAVEKLKTQDDLVIMCHHGGRSERAARWLLQNGYQSVRNLKGGIDAWSLQVDPSIPRY